MLDNRFIFIFEMKNEDRLLIPIIKIIRSNETPYISSDFIFGFGNKIIIIGFKKEIAFTYNVCTNEQESFKINIDNTNLYNYHYQTNCPFMYTLVLPNCKQTWHKNV